MAQWKKNMFFLHFNILKFQFDSTIYDSFFFKLFSFHFKLPILLFFYTTDNIIQLTEYCIMPVPNKCN